MQMLCSLIRTMARGGGGWQHRASVCSLQFVSPSRQNDGSLLGVCNKHELAGKPPGEIGFQAQAGELLVHCMLTMRTFSSKLTGRKPVPPLSKLTGPCGGSVASTG